MAINNVNVVLAAASPGPAVSYTVPAGRQATVSIINIGIAQMTVNAIVVYNFGSTPQPLKPVCVNAGDVIAVQGTGASAYLSGQEYF